MFGQLEMTLFHVQEKPDVMAQELHVPTVTAEQCTLVPHGITVHGTSVMDSNTPVHGLACMCPLVRLSHPA